MNKAAFIDKDGTLINDVPYNVKPELISYSNSAMEALRLLQDEGYLLIVITNQSGIAKGLFTEHELGNVISKIRNDLSANSIHLTGFYYCPHLPATTSSEACDCRKPAAGMILNAARDFNIDLSQSWMIGDILDDMEAGKRASCKTILLDVGNETKWEMNAWRLPDYYADDLLEAAHVILNERN